MESQKGEKSRGGAILLPLTVDELLEPLAILAALDTINNHKDQKIQDAIDKYVITEIDRDHRYHIYA